MPAIKPKEVLIKFILNSVHQLPVGAELSLRVPDEIAFRKVVGWKLKMSVPLQAQEGFAEDPKSFSKWSRISVKDLSKQ